MEEEEVIPEHKRFINERKDKTSIISMQMIARTSLESGVAWSEDEHIDQLIQLKVIHLEWLAIPQIQNLEVFSDLTILYLQHNRISRIEGLESLFNLEYIALNGNQITKVENLGHLNRLSGLNLSHNCIEELETSQLPLTLSVVSFAENPVCLDVSYKEKLLRRLKQLEMLDDTTITPADKFKILGLLPSKVATYASQVKQFYTKREIQTRIQQDSKPLLLNTEVINEKEILCQIRETTRRHKHKNQEAFKKDKREQDEHFKEKLAVSKKIRQIKEEEEGNRASRLKEIKDFTIDQLMMQKK